MNAEEESRKAKERIGRFIGDGKEEWIRKADAGLRAINDLPDDTPLAEAKRIARKTLGIGEYWEHWKDKP